MKLVFNDVHWFTDVSVGVDEDDADVIELVVGIEESGDEASKGDGA